jgi:hypothetical protein
MNISDANPADDTAVAARFNRLLGICKRIRWNDFGVPSRESKQARDALEDLAEFLFTDAVDRVVEEHRQGGEP